ncbi:calcium-binding protein [uncultured Celeribacter sp.]|uniref:calcium-binding protein n=1 Tax=uncultured Celeribacter sp. TaxID=1303376 RepID=UPI002AA7FC59|nr:calcium-binding protein [uncultured Celeribacter sp.]
MSTETISLSLPSTESVSAEHFGVNFVDAYEAIDSSNWNDNKFEDLNDFIDGGAADMGLTSLRWSGGSDIEKYEITGTTTGTVELSAIDDLGNNAKTLSLGNGSADNTQNENLGTFLEFCGNNNIEATIIIPTEWLVDTQYKGPNYVADQINPTDLASIEAYVEKVMELAAEHNVTIAGFEIGNEYQSWFTPQGYAEVLNAVVPVVHSVVGEDGPDIIAQMAINTKDDGGLSLDEWEYRNENGVWQNVDSVVANAIDGLASHFYYQEGQETQNGSDWVHSYDNIDDLVAKFAEMASAWGTDIDLHMTEWGVSKTTLTGEEANFGLRQLAPTLEMFSAMIKHGVDSADIWPLLYKDSSLAQNEHLKPVGQLFDLMNDHLIGKNVVEFTLDSDDYDIHGFIGGGEGAAFFSSFLDSSQDLTIDLTDMYGLRGEVTVYIIESDDYTDANAWGSVTTSAGADTYTINAGGTISLRLDAYETAVIVYDAVDLSDYAVVTQASVEYQDATHGTSYKYLDEAVTNDLIIGTDVHDWIRTGDGNDYINGGAGADALYGGKGNDIIVGGAGNDYIAAGANSDTVYGGTGEDIVYGGLGEDRIWAGDGDDLIHGDGGTGHLYGELGDDILHGGNSRDYLYGGGGNDLIVGNGGDDEIYGHNGNDTIRGGGGADVITGGNGNDTFVFNDGFGLDVITDFEATNDNETIDLSDVSAITGFSDLQSNHMSQSGSDVLITVDANNVITLENVLLSDLEAADFLF